MHEFKLPDIGEGLVEAELLLWTVKAGEQIKEGDEVAQISTDKVNVDLLAPVSGTVAELIGRPGEIIAVGAVIMRIDTGHSTGAESMVTAENTPVNMVPTRPAEVPTSATSKLAIMAAPIVRKYAADKDVDLSQFEGSGPDGQITRADVDKCLHSKTANDRNRSKPKSVSPGTIYRLSGARLAAARNLTKSHTSQVTTTISFEVMADSLEHEINQLTAEAKSRDLRLTPAALVAKRLATILLAHPKFNATIGDGESELLLHENVNMGIAVTTGEGLLVPVIRGVEQKSVLEVSAEISRLSDLARSGDIIHSDLTGSSFTLSNTGGLEKATLTATTPIINYPNVATLWMSRVTTRPRVRDGKLEAGPVMYCSLSFDHRFLHGADGIGFVNDLASLLSV